LAEEKKFFDSQDYVKKMKEDPHMMDWFSKPTSVL